MIRRLLLVLLSALALAAPAGAATPQFSMGAIEQEVMCPVCGTRLDMSHSPAAEEIRTYIASKRDLGWSKQRVEAALVNQFGPTIMADTPTSGSGLGAWVAPLVVGLGGTAIAAVAILAWRRRGIAAEPPGSLTALDDETARRVDAALAAFEDDGTTPSSGAPGTAG